MNAGTQTHQRLLEQLIAAISRLARPADAQIAYLEALGPGDSANELALELDDVLEAALAVPDLLTEEQETQVRGVDDQLGEMSGIERSELWTRDAVRTSPAWMQVRVLARSALRELHADSVVSR